MWANPGQAAYATAKAGVVMLTKCMALDGAKDGIRVNGVCAGLHPDAHDRALPRRPGGPGGPRTGVEALHPLGRLGEPRDIADAFVYLASDEARWVTGTTLVGRRRAYRRDLGRVSARSSDDPFELGGRPAGR